MGTLSATGYWFLTYRLAPLPTRQGRSRTTRSPPRTSLSATRSRPTSSPTVATPAAPTPTARRRTPRPQVPPLPVSLSRSLSSPPWVWLRYSCKRIPGRGEVGGCGALCWKGFTTNTMASSCDVDKRFYSLLGWFEGVVGGGGNGGAGDLDRLCTSIMSETACIA